MDYTLHENRGKFNPIVERQGRLKESREKKLKQREARREAIKKEVEEKRMKFKPCPFCGSTKIDLFDCGDKSCVFGQCQVCGSSGPATENEDDVVTINKWNTRV